MTLHMIYNHECPKCGAYYTPYDKKISCPKCGLVEKKRFDFIAQAVDSIRFNLMNYGSFVPPAWAELSFADSVLYTIFWVFKDFKKNNSGASFEDYAKRALAVIDLKDHAYFREHMLGICIKIYEEIKGFI